MCLIPDDLWLAHTSPRVLFLNYTKWVYLVLDHTRGRVRQC